MGSVLSAESLCFSYNSLPFIENASFSIEHGEMVSVLGANGSGKSTLFALMNGTLKPRSGQVMLCGRPILELSVRKRACVVASVYQNTECRFPFTCFELVEMGTFPNGGRGGADFINEIMERTDTAILAGKPATELSGGELQRVLIARALAQRPELLLLDEAMSGLDIAVKLRLTSLLRSEAKKNGMSIVMIRHDIEEAFRDSDRIIALRKGRILYDGRPHELMKEQFFEDIYDVHAEVSGNGFRITGTVY